MLDYSDVIANFHCPGIPVTWKFVFAGSGGIDFNPQSIDHKTADDDAAIADKVRDRRGPSSDLSGKIENWKLGSKLASGLLLAVYQ
jgi:hypothetical protein